MRIRIPFLISMMLLSISSLYATVHVVEVSNNAYAPSELEVMLGDTVRFVWFEGNHPTVSGIDGVNDNVFEALPVNENNPIVDLELAEPGVYPFFCALHWMEGMIGQITVVGGEENPCTDLFFSEYIEGSGNNKAFEIYNPTEGIVDLSEYYYRRYNNGNTEPSFIDTLEGLIMAGDVFLICHPEADPIIANQADLINNSITAFNGDDVLELYHGNILIDVFGLKGEDPGAGWPLEMGDTHDVTMVRKSSISSGQLDWAIGITEWDVYENNTFDYINSHNSDDCFSIGGGACNDLFISEYVEGNENNKAIELFNAKPEAIDLSEYSLERYSNGSTEPSFSLDLDGVLNGFNVFVIANTNINPDFNDAINVFSDLCIFDGNDALVLKKGDQIIDVVGLVGDDPGAFWAAGADGATADFSLRRQNIVSEGGTDWTEVSMQWDAFPADDLTGLGMHSNICGSSAPQVSLPGNETVFENVETIEIEIELTNLDECYDFILGTAGSAELNVDFVISETNFTVCEGDESIVVEIAILEDTLMEGNETIILFIGDPTNGLTVGNNEMTINIVDNDLPVSSIGDLLETNSDGIALSDGSNVEVRGVVYGPNFRSFGLQFALIDPSGGIAVFLDNGNLGYSPVEGDSLHILGEIGQFRGLIQVYPTQIDLISSDNALKEPRLVQDLDESTEVELVQLNCVRLKDASEWTNSGTGFNVMMTDGERDFLMRIEDDVNVFGTNPPAGLFDVVGLGWQYSSSLESPYLDGYQIFPRYLDDIIVSDMNAEFSTSSQDLLVNFTADESVPADAYSWDFGDGNTGEGASASNQYATNGAYEIKLTVEWGACIDVQKMLVQVGDVVGLGEIDLSEIEMYPNPTADFINIKLIEGVNQVEIIDLNGRILSEWQFEEGQNKQIINLSEFSTGQYFVRFSGNGGIFVDKLSIIR